MGWWRVVVAGAMVAGAWVAVVAAEPEREGQTYRSRGGGYSVQLPGPPQESSRKVRTRLGTLPLHVATYATAAGEAYLAGYAELPSGSDAETVLNGVAEGLIREGPQLSQQKILFGMEQWPGREITWRKGSWQMRCRVVVREQRLYVVMVVGEEAFVSGPAAKQFIESLTLER